MTTRKNTQGAKDSLKGGTPEQAEAPISAADTGTDQQPTGSSDDGNTGAATGQDTESAEDSLEGAQPGQAEADSVVADFDQPPPGGSDGDDTGATADPEHDEARAALMRAVAIARINPVKILPPTTLIRIIRRGATVIDTIIHDGNVIAPGGTVFVSQAEFAGLLRAKAVADVDWDELEEEPF